MTQSAAVRSELSDAALAARVREGDVDAYGDLWRRHSAAGLAVARQFSNLGDPEDLLSEASLRILRALQAGGGPREVFRTYLYRTIRNVAMGDRDRPVLVDLNAVPDAAAPGDRGTEARVADATLLARAFEHLPESWRNVLWYTEVEGLTPADAGPMLGMSANAASALAVRAREGLKKEWLQAHVSEVQTPERCELTRRRLGAFARRSLTPRARRQVEEHLDDCAACTLIARDLGDLERKLAAVLLPALIGGPAASGLLFDRGASASALANENDSLMPHGRRLPRGRVAAGVAAAAVIIAAGTVSLTASGHSRMPGATPERAPDAAAEAHPRTVALSDEEDRPTLTSSPTASASPLPSRSPSPSLTPTPVGTPQPEPDAGRPRLDTGTALAPIPVMLTIVSLRQPLLFVPVLTGTAPAGARVLITDDAGAEVGSAISSDAGRWSALVMQADLEAGALMITMSYPGADASTLTIGPYTFAVPAITGPSDADVIPVQGDATAVDVQVAGIIGASVQLWVDGTTDGVAHEIDAGAMSIRTAGLAPGMHRLGVGYVDPVTGSTGSVATIVVTIGWARGY